jgi:hypothetical protein
MHETTVRGLVLEPSSRVRPNIVEPLIRVLVDEATDQRIAGTAPAAGTGHPVRGRTFTTGYVFRQKLKSSISPSFVKDHPDPARD